MKSKAILFVAIALVFTSAAQAGPTIVISEVFYDEPGRQTKYEWIELYNPTSNPIDIGGYTIKDNQAGIYTIALGTIILPGQTLIFARDTEGFRSLYGFDPDFGDFNRPLGNTGDFLILKDAAGTEIDVVAWEGGISGWNLVADEGESIQRWSLAQGPGAWLSHRSPNPGSPAPIPEPASVVLLGLGLFGSILSAGRKLLMKP